jgi:calcineurin-like phosphoesterase family protein
MTIWYISDTHFGHTAVIGMCNRPFSTIEEMDSTIIANWNARVRPGDQIMIVGDLIYRAENPPEHYLRQLSGYKHLILGNHDSKWIKKVKLEDYFKSVSQIKEFPDSGKNIVLCHYPMAEWPRFYRENCLHVFGHIHNHSRGPAFNCYLQQPRMLNAGVDVNNFMPVRLDELINNNMAFKEKCELADRKADEGDQYDLFNG